MFDHLSSSERLRLQSARLLAVASHAADAAGLRAEELDKLIHNALALAHRRAAFNPRDAACYRLGSAFESVDGADLDAVAMTGWLHLGTLGLLLLASVALERPNLTTIADQLRALFDTPAGDAVRAHGVWVRWHWRKRLYDKEVAEFEASPQGRNPKAAWRRKPPKADQIYLAAAICADLEIEQPTFRTRGEAHDWLRARGGNPKFKYEPPRPDLDALAEAFG